MYITCTLGNEGTLFEWTSLVCLSGLFLAASCITGGGAGGFSLGREVGLTVGWSSEAGQGSSLSGRVPWLAAAALSFQGLSRRAEPGVCY